MDSLPPEIKVHSLVHGIRFELPKRNLGSAKFVSLFMIPFGLVFVTIAISRIITGFGPDLFSILFALPFLAAGLMTIALGVFAWAGHTEIELNSGALSVTERAGFLRWKRSRSTNGIRRFEVAKTPVIQNDEPITKGPLADIAVIQVEFENARPMLLGVGYPKTWLLTIANRLSNELQTKTLVSVKEKFPVIEVDSPNDPDRVVDLQPVNSKIKLDSLPNGISLTIPPAGLWRGSKGFFAFGLIWTIFSTVIFGTILFADKSSEILPVIAFGLLFEAVGVGMLLGAINMGKRRALIIATDTELKCAIESIFGIKKFAWPRTYITRIAVGPSGMTINDVPVLELQIHAMGDKKPNGFFAGRDETELRWVATVLRKTLRLSP